MVGELAGHPVVFDDVGLGVLFEGPVFEFGFVGWFPVGYLDVVEHAYGSVDGCVDLLEIGIGLVVMGNDDGIIRVAAKRATRCES